MPAKDIFHNCVMAGVTSIEVKKRLDELCQLLCQCEAAKGKEGTGLLIIERL
jgi:hypothetical protein